MHFIRGASLVVQSIKNLPAVQETQVPSLGLNVYLEKEVATHSSTLSWKILLSGVCRATVHGLKRVR